MSDLSYNCILQFDDQSPSFAHGFRAGVIWEKTKTGEPFTDQFSGDNLELIQRMASRLDYAFHIEDAGNGWFNLTATPL